MNAKPITLAFVLLLSGCASTGGGNLATWYNPATWFSGSAGRTVESVTRKVNESTDAVLTGAQRSAHEAQEALKQAGDSRPVEVARNANDRTVTQLDQALGPLTVDEAEKIRKQNSLLLSENAELRAEGEKLLQKEKATERKNSETLSKWSVALTKANATIAESFARENALANKYRNLVFGFWGLVVVAVIGVAASVYLKYFLGGFPAVTGKVLSAVRARFPEQADEITKIYDTHFDRDEQAKIAKHT